MLMVVLKRPSNNKDVTHKILRLQLSIYDQAIAEQDQKNILIPTRPPPREA